MPEKTALSEGNQNFIHSLCEEFVKHNRIDPASYDRFDVKRGLRSADGTGVVAGVTHIGNVQGYYMQDGEKVPMAGRLIYRGISVEELITGFRREGRFGFEETAYLLLLGALPTGAQLAQFKRLLASYRALPPQFTEDMILKAPGADVMNKLARSVLALYSYDENPDDLSLENQLSQALKLVARCPTAIAHSFAAKRHYFDGESLYLHRPQEDLSAAENFLYSVRLGHAFTPQEAQLLDLCLVLHAEHGGGNNSAFACRVLSSSGTDIYSAIAAAVGSLKGPRHGGANQKVMQMFAELQKNVQDWTSDAQLIAYLEKILQRQAGDGSGLIYGMGHAIYTLSDPRAVLLKTMARALAAEKGMAAEFALTERVERLAPALICKAKREIKPVAANVDLYSGLVYQMLGIPQELYTPLFAMARMVGWCAHRIEEVTSPGGKIIRPAYKSVAPARAYLPLSER